MSTKPAAAVDRVYNPSEVLDHYSEIYLNQYWPEVPHSAPAWADNAVLMLAYQEAALAVKNFFKGKAVKMLDISTGPALAPLLAMLTCVSEVQLSDFHETNRRHLQEMPIAYWRNYVPMLTKIVDHPDRQVPRILARLDELRSQHKPVEVDLFREAPLPASVKPFDYELISMQFVADGITKTEHEFLRCFGKVTDMVRPGGALIMSATVDCHGWQLGPNQEPSPNIPESTILGFLAAQNLKVLSLSRSMRHTGLTYSGGWIVLAAARI